MADGQVIITLSVQDAEAVRAWQRAKEGIGGMEQELGKAKRATAAVGDEVARTSKKLGPWEAGLSRIAVKHADQARWASGMKTLETQRATVQADQNRKADQQWKFQEQIAKYTRASAKNTIDMATQMADVETSGSGMAAKISDLVGGFAKMAAGAFSVKKAVDVLRQEYDALVARGKAAAGFQVSLGGAQRAMIRNLSGQELTVEQTDTAVKEISVSTGADLVAVTNATSNALSARGPNISEKEAVAQVAATARMDPSLAGDELGLITGAALDVRKAFGGTSEQALGAMLTSQQTARIVSAQDFATNAAPALLGLQAFGDNYREASALFSTITQRSADVSGRRSGTAAIRFAQQLKEATPFLKDASTAARREFLLSGDPEAEKIRKRLLGSMRQDYDASETAEGAESDPTRKAELHAEAKQYVAMLELLERGSKTFKAYEQTYAATPEYEQAGERYEQNIKAQRQLGLQRTVRQAEIGRAALQTALQEEERGAVSQIRTDLDSLLEQAGSFGRAGAAETGFLSTLGQIEVGADRRMEKGQEDFFGMKQQHEWHDSRQVRAMNVAIGVAEKRVDNAKRAGQYENPEFARTRRALEGYIAAQRKERDQLIEDLAAKKKGTSVMAPPKVESAEAEPLFEVSWKPGKSAKPMDHEAQMRQYSEAAREFRIESERPKEAKKDAKEQKKADTDAKKLAAQIKALEAKKISASEAVKKADETLAADDRGIEEMRRRQKADAAAHAVALASPAQTPWSSGHTRRRASPTHSAATQMHEAESDRRKQVAIDEAERKRERDAAALQKRQDELKALTEKQNALLAQQNEHLANIERHVRPDGGQDSTPTVRGAPQRPLPVIGGN